MTEDDTYNALRRVPIWKVEPILEILHKLKDFNKLDYNGRRARIDKELSPFGWNCDSFEIAKYGQVTPTEHTSFGNEE